MGKYTVNLTVEKDKNGKQYLKGYSPHMGVVTLFFDANVKIPPRPKVLVPDTGVKRPGRRDGVLTCSMRVKGKSKKKKSSYNGSYNPTYRSK